jgi:hypothetical protein
LTTIENHEGNLERSSEKLTYRKEVIQWRRSRVLELDSQGYTYNEIVSKLQIGKGTVCSDLAYLRQQAQENLRKHIHEVVPMEYQRGMIGLRYNLKHILEIADSSSDPRIKLEARRVANDCYRYIMDLCTNAGIISDALKYVNGKAEKLENQNQEPHTS